MRDVYFLALLPLILYAMARRPFIAVGMWFWTAMFFPNAWLYGMGVGIRYNLIFTAIAILGYLAMKDKPRVQFGALGGVIFLFFFWTTVSTVMTEGLPEIAWEYWVRFFKVMLLFVFIVLVLQKKLHVEFFVWCAVASIGFYGGLEALKFVASGGGHMIAGFHGHALGDRNELALAFVMILPLCGYLVGEYGQRSNLIRLGLLGLMGLLVAAIIGTQSRGGFLALMGLAGYMFIKSERKILLAILTVILVAALSNIVSDDWASRMDTISEAGDDASFMGRVTAWKLSFIMAMRHPIFGGGFKALEYFPVWASLSQDFFMYPFFYTGDALPNPTTARAAHSVYFQVMGDHGFVGLGIYLSFLALAFMGARKITLEARRFAETAWIAHLASMLQLSIFAFCLGGAGLSFAYFEMLYAMFGLIVVLRLRILPAASKDLTPLPPKQGWLGRKKGKLALPLAGPRSA
ncbi:putative O-glycosylation ligase, exosortase A system-associated [Massilia sp. PAMC28688]|uniref:putative O-glycosylation ligase, exosortase A system-associated n=1 Tax=Massilia sp. PAMC28688 TaxID=2861283 RepID=UPI001C62A494|nr:putative O-glycosylation ligase, exosortase A system-associated [Massilia sp. PAMC28688]QYF95083.1 putative O-glycosylation ligase, exosortase A system-associated [Massilia sp. PAMC28688]